MATIKVTTAKARVAAVVSALGTGLGTAYGLAQDGAFSLSDYVVIAGVVLSAAAAGFGLTWAAPYTLITPDKKSGE